MNWSAFASEFAARRRRLRKALGDWRSSLLEFSLLAGTLMGASSQAFGPKGFLGAYYGPFLPVLALVGYVVIEQARQRALTQGTEEVALRASFDRRALFFLIAVAAIGYATFVWALFAPPPFELVPETPPARTLDVTIGPG